VDDRWGGHALVGRDEDLAWLTDVLEDVRAGQTTAVVLSGEAGVGKTRLVQELELRAELDGAVVLHSGAMDIVDSPPFWPVVSALRGLLHSAERPAIADVLSRWADQLMGLLAPAPPAEHVQEPVQTLALLRCVIAELASEAVVVLVVEDLQWVDRSTRDLLLFLIADLNVEPVLLVATYRIDAHRGSAEVRGLLAEMRRHRRVRCREVEPLSREAVTELVHANAPDVRSQLADLVWRRSAGNAFIAEETLRAAVCGDPRALPVTLRDLVLDGIAQLTPAAQYLVKAVAVCDGPLPHRLLSAVADQPEDALLTALREAVDAAVVIVDPNGDGYRLRHGLITEVLVAELLPGERLDLHRRYATALEQSGAAGLPGLDARLAHHWQLAGDPDRALTAAAAAAGAADRMRGHAEAHDHWLRAARLVERAADPGPLTSDLCLERAAGAAHLAGDHDEAIALFGEVLARTDEPRRAAVLHARIARVLLAAGKSLEAVHAFRRAAELVPSDSTAERAEVLSGYAEALRHTGEFATSRAVGQEAIDLAKQAGLPSAEARALAEVGFSLAYLHDHATGLSVLRHALEVAESAGEPADIACAHLNLAELLSGPLNELESGVVAARMGVQRVTTLGLARTSGVALLSLAANGLFRLGQWSEAGPVLEEAWALAPTGADALELRLARARLLTGRGDFAAAEDDLEAVDLLSVGSVGPRYRVPLLTLRAGLEMWRGHPDRALEHVAAALDVVEQGSDDVWVVAPLLWHGARARAEHTRLGMRPPETAISARLRHHTAELVGSAEATVPPVREMVLTFVDMCAAEDARADGRSEPEAWARIADFWTKRRQPYPTAYAHLKQAEALFGQRTRSASGADALRSAEQTARQLGAVPLLAEIVELAERARVSLAGPAAAPDQSPVGVSDPVEGALAGGPGGDELEELTPRELEVLTELAAGLTNREIAQRLFISEKTVSVHLGRIFTKMGVHTRVQASGVFFRARGDLRGRLHTATNRR
jgi:DNA-binding CsgD family transcriptional regulator/tetratricopeptide (TPR) repeat protein